MSSCGPQDVSIVVNVSGLTDDVVQLSVNASAGSQSASSEVTESLSQFALHLVSLNLADPSSGVLSLTISGIGADGCQRSAATVKVSLPPPGPISVTLTAARGCKLVVGKSGSGQGQVSTEDGSFTCKFDGAPLPDPTCTTQVAGACAVCLPLGTQVALTAVPQPAAVPHAYFAGWTGACSGPALCQIAISSGEIDVGAGFLPTQACSPDGFCWEHPLPQGNQLEAVWSSAPNDVWLVGDAGSLLHWNGSFLIPYAAGTTNNLHSVWGSGKSDVWAVGDFGTLLHYDGNAWSPAKSPTTENLNSIWGSGQSDVWAVGGATNFGTGQTTSTLLHYDGSAWSAVASPVLGPLTSIWGSGPSDVFAVSYGPTNGSGILHYDGNAWSVVPSIYSTVQGIWGSGPNDVWAWGDSGLTAAGTLLHYDGNSWTQSVSAWSAVVANGELPPITSVWGSSPSDVWAVGPADTSGDLNITGSTIYRFDGSSWGIYSYQPAAGSLVSLFGSGPNDVWTAGSTIFHFDGEFWSQASEALTPNDRKPLQAVWGSGTDSLFAVGLNGTVLRYLAGAWTQVTEVFFPITSSFYGIWGSDPNNIWIAGGPYNSALFQYSQGFWSDSSFSGGALMAAWGSSASDVWAVGQFPGVVEHYTQGKGWSVWSQPASYPDLINDYLAGIWGSGPTDIWAVGGAGDIQIIHFDGTGWSPWSATFTSSIRGSLNGIWGSGPSDVWTVGVSGLAGIILHYDGTAWSQVTIPTLPSLNGIWGSGPDDIWIVGNAGTILHYDGTSFQSLQSGTSHNLYAVWGRGPGDAIAVGDAGTILHRRPSAQ